MDFQGLGNFRRRNLSLHAVITCLFLLAVCWPGWVLAGDYQEQLNWEGHGGEHANVGEDCAAGFWHWILTPGGNQVITGARLTVTYSSGETSETEGYSHNPQGRGAWHFDVTHGDNEVVSAFVEFNYEGEGQGKTVLTISNSHCTDENGDDENGDDENGDDENGDDEDDEEEEEEEEELPETGGLPVLGIGLGMMALGLLIHKKRF